MQVFIIWVAAFILRLSSIGYVVSLSLVTHSHVLMIEMLLITLALFLLKKRTFKLIFGLPIIILSIIDLVNIVITGRHIDVTTLINIGFARAIGQNIYIQAIIYSVIYLLLWIPDLIFNIKINNSRIQFVQSIWEIIQRFKLNYILAIILLGCCSLLIKTPSYHVVEALDQAYNLVHFQPPLTEDLGDIFIKERVVDRTEPLVINNQSFSFKDFNVVLIFTEGTSLKVISPDVTPNAYALMKEGLFVKNYFNHTAATYRGLRGQLISGYQSIGGYYNDKSGLNQIQISENNGFEKIIQKQESLPSVLNQHGYETIFINPEKDQGNSSHIMRYVGFNTVKGNKQDTFAITDRQLYENIWQELTTLDQQKKKFLLASYIFGSHEGQDSPDLKYKDGSNPYLNKFYNQDHWFGEFFKKFKNSPLAQNTILIFTTDHASYPSREFIETFHSDSPFFIDYVPLFIYNPILNKDGGMIFDAQNRNSLSLTPTILDLLDITKEKNHFLGNSIFDHKKPNEYERLSIYGNEYIYLDENGKFVSFPKHRITKDEKFRKLFPNYRELMDHIVIFLNYSG